MHLVPDPDSTDGHESMRAFYASIMACHALVIAAYYMQVPVLLFIVFLAILVIPGVWFARSMMKHRFATCSHCIRVILDATDDPSQYSPCFRSAHLIIGPATWIAKATRLHPTESSNAKIITVSIATLITVYSPVVVVAFLVPFPWTFVTAMTGIELVTWILNTHERLIMFCPLCRGRGGRGGDNHHAPEPTPTPSSYIA